MTHLTDELVAQAIEHVLGKDSGWEPNGHRVEGYSINIDKDAYVTREDIERLRLRLNTIERNAGGTNVLVFWRIHLYQECFELRYQKSDHAMLAESYPEALNLPMYDDEDGDIVDGFLSFVAYMVRLTKGEREANPEIYDFASDFCERPTEGHYLFNGQKTYDGIRSYLWKHNNSRGRVILDRIVRDYRAYCKEHGLKNERIDCR